MIQSLYIDNFKALNDFTIELKPLTVLIGTNGSGKTTILQALDLISNFVRMDLDTYLEKRNWKPSELKSKTNKKLHMTFRVIFKMGADDIEWTFVLNPVKTKEKINVVSEEIINITKQKVLLSVDSQGINRFNFQQNLMEKFPPLNMTSSFLKNIDAQKDKAKFPELATLIEFMTESDSFELLSTERMRKSSRGEADTIGMGGEKLAAFIHGLQPEQKKNLSRHLHNYMPFINEVDTEVKGRPGWIEIKVAENFPAEEKSFTISPAHISDGTLRMIAISALQETDKTSGMVLLDEIENGINPHIADKMVYDLIERRGMQRQIIVTTHSSVMLDYFPPESIVFIWRNGDGVVHNQALFLNPDLSSQLKYMYPGEVWINTDEKDIIAKLLGEK